MDEHLICGYGLKPGENVCLIVGPYKKSHLMEFKLSSWLKGG